MKKLFLIWLMLILSILACTRTQPDVVVITATPETTTILPPEPNSISTAFPALPLVSPTPDPTHSSAVSGEERQYVVQAGDTLYAIAQMHGVSLESLLEVNPAINPDVLSVGQIINLPAAPNAETSAFKIISDSRLVRGPNSAFDVEAFLREQPGYIRTVTDRVKDVPLTASQVIQRVSLEYSVDVRLLLALLEFRAGWLSNAEPSDTAKTYPLEGVPTPAGYDRSGLYKQLAWAANRLNFGYYGWQYRNLSNIEFEDGTRLRYAPGLNAGTVGVQFFLSQNNDYYTWERQISQDGFYQTYTAYFGDPFISPDPLLPPGLQQPPMTLPFVSGETWFFTGGPHGGWGSGSAWSAIDFAPPDDIPEGGSACYISQFWATAVAPGIIARSEEGSVILDLDGDNDESTGWTVLYLHMATEGRVPAGTYVQIGDQIGHPSCEGGFSTATHMHIARRYNGAWIPAYCDQCVPEMSPPPFVLGGWMIFGFADQEYQGYMLNGNDRRNAEQGRLTPENRVSW